MSALIWGQRVQLGDETHACFGRVGIYEGTICAETGALRIRFPAGVVVAREHQLLSIEDPVTTRRRLKRSGARPQVRQEPPAPACLFADHGKTEAEQALETWLETGDESSLDVALRAAFTRRRVPRRCVKKDTAGACGASRGGR